MYRKGEEIHVSTTEAKAGRRGSFVFQVLLLSLGIALLAMAAMFIFGSETAPDQGGPVTAASGTP